MSMMFRKFLLIIKKLALQKQALWTDLDKDQEELREEYIK